jgi:hypothetical protein
MAQEIPIACRLTSAELQKRRSEVLQHIIAAITKVTETKEGFVYQFSSAPNQLAELGNLIELEHQCCPFLTFRLTVEPGDGPASLELSGPPGTKDFLTTLFQ